VGGNLNMTGADAAAKAVALGGNLTVGGDANIGALTGPTASANIIFNGATASIVSYAAKATASTDTFAGAAALTIGTLTDIGSASQVTFNGPTTITDPVTVGASGLTIAGTGNVTLKKAPDTTAGALTVQNTAGVTLEEVTVIAANITATNVTIKGGSTGTPIGSTGVTAIVADGSIIVPAEGSIVAGTGTDTITITGATLGAGTYTATAGQLSLSTTAVITVDGGIDIAGAGDLALTLAATSVIFNENSYLDVKDATGKFGEADPTDTKVSVTGAAGNGKATVVKGAGNDWTITDDAAGTAAVTVILGTLKLALTGTTAITNIAGTDASGEAAPGKLIAGPGTTITFDGTN
jgi:hypothetical protein